LTIYPDEFLQERNCLSSLTSCILYATLHCGSTTKFVSFTKNEFI